MAKKLIVFNWKMYPKKAKDVEGILLAFDGARIDTGAYEVAIAPPAIYLAEIVHVAEAPLALAAQNCAWEREGAYTGELSPDMIKQFGVRYVIIGHSERRIHFGETDAMVGRRVTAAIKGGLTAIVCVGEPREVRKKGKAAVKQYIRKQIDGAFRDMRFPALQSKKIIMAYEPVWAIGTGVSATVNDAIEVIDFIRTVLAVDYAMKQVRVLYGGSVNGDNIADFVKRPGIDGALIGGASVDKKELKKILKTLKS